MKPIKDFTSFWMSINYMLELILGTNIFLYACPKRKCFPYALPLVSLILLGCNFLSYNSTYLNEFIYFLKMISMFLLLLVSMYLCYKVKFLAVFAACIGGMALQHIGYHCSLLLCMIPGVTEAIPAVYIEDMVCLLLFVLSYFTLGRVVAQNEFYKTYDRRMIILGAIMIFVCLVIMRFIRYVQFKEETIPPMILVALSLYAIICCFLSLFLLFYLWRFVSEKNRQFIQLRLAEEIQKQYKQQRKENEQLNIKFHDLKYKLNSLEGNIPEKEKESVLAMLSQYDGTYHTGNEALDTILNKESLTCLQHKISLTFMGNGALLDFVDPLDVYSMFGNMLDNAIESVRKLEDKQKRVISVTIENKGDLVLVTCLNYTKEKVRLVNGFPETTKTGERGYHGFGVKSIANIAEKYHGSINIQNQDDVFTLTVFLFRKDQKQVPDR